MPSGESTEPRGGAAGARNKSEEREEHSHRCNGGSSPDAAPVGSSKSQVISRTDVRHSICSQERCLITELHPTKKGATAVR